MLTEILCHFLWPKEAGSCKILTLPNPFCLKPIGIWNTKIIPGPFAQQGWSPTLKLVQMSGGALPTFLPLSSDLPIRSFLFSLFLSRTSSLLTTASILEPMLFMDCSRCSTRCRRLGKTWRTFTTFFLVMNTKICSRYLMDNGPDLNQEWMLHIRDADSYSLST